MKRPIVFALCAALTASCTTGTRLTRSPTIAQVATVQSDASVMRGAASAIPAGTRIRLRLVSGRDLKATLLQVEDDIVIVSPRTRIPEPPLRIGVDQILSVERDSGTGVGKGIAIGVAIGAAATLAIIFAIVASLD